MTSTARVIPACLAMLAGLAIPVLVATPAAAAADLVLVTNESPTNSSTYKDVRVHCPAGTKILGGGGDVVGGGNSVRIQRLAPSTELPSGSFVAAASEDSYAYSGSWSVKVWGICGSGVAGHEIVKAEWPGGSTFGWAQVSCPAGKTVIGAGGAVFSTPWLANSPFVLDTISVGPSMTAVMVEAMGDEFTPVPGTTAFVQSFAICINPLPGQQLVSSSTGETPDTKSVSVQCPPGTRVHGAAGGLSKAGGQAYIDALVPIVRTQGVYLDAHEDSTGYNGPGPFTGWTATAVAICAL